MPGKISQKQISMVHSSEQAFNTARQILNKNNISYIEIGTPELKSGYHHNSVTTDVWIVSYTYMVFQEEIAFVYLDDLNRLKLLHILTKHGYITY